MMKEKRGTVVLVTGASGFLGQHVVKMLQTRADHVQEIRVLDLVPFTCKLDYKQEKPVHITIGSITDPNVLHEVCRGVDCVMHLASFIDISLFPDKEMSYKINVEGTRNVIDACRKCKVARLIYCSSIEVVRGSEHLYNATEYDTPTPDKFIFEVYGSTKKQAEDLVIQANCAELSTICLRPTGIYGDLEARFSPGIACSWLGKITGYYMAVNCGKGEADMSYVGNCAWAFVCADKTLQGPRSHSAAGNAYFIRDETPCRNVTELMVQIFEEAGFKQFPLTVPLWFLAFLFFFIYPILKVVRVLYPVNIQFGSDAWGINLKTVFHCSCKKAELLLHYNPIFSFKESKRLTVAYINKLKHC